MKKATRRSLAIPIVLAGISLLLSQPASAQSDPPRWGWAQTWYNDEGTMKKHADFPCLDDHEWPYPQWPIDWVYNVDCPRRFWLHENRDHSGHDICVGPGKSNFIPERYSRPALIAVGARKPCP
ncbi:hypothetical protein GCM10018785_45130 [Streptomyces longispororuber]|uniref:Secreted protein n=1 Tax=Streptomyces longispororuber TaxID=68230 RepID=A0A919DS94_9ACTN|nr:hypothetical protein GCM10018785_45130 [Streptomyces longispororuber]